MNLLAESVGLSHYLVVGAILFVCGVLCMATKRNVIGVLLGIELVLNGANLNFVAQLEDTLEDGPTGYPALQVVHLFTGFVHIKGSNDNKLRGRARK